MQYSLDNAGAALLREIRTIRAKVPGVYKHNGPSAITLIVYTYGKGGITDTMRIKPGYFYKGIVQRMDGGIYRVYLNERDYFLAPEANVHGILTPEDE